jgi:hypothetical protein
LLLASWIAVALAFHTWAGGDWLPGYGSRYIVQVVPLGLLLAALGAARVGALLKGAGAKLRAVGVCGLATAAGIAANPGEAAREWFDPRAPTLLHADNQTSFERGRFLARTTRADTTFAVHWAGIGPYFADRRAIDVLGRCDRHIARIEVDRFIPGHSKWEWDYVLDTRAPDIIDLESRNLRRHPSFRRNYVAVVMNGTPNGEGRLPVLFARRDALDKILDPEVEILPLEAIFPERVPPIPGERRVSTW